VGSPGDGFGLRRIAFDIGPDGSRFHQFPSARGRVAIGQDEYDHFSLGIGEHDGRVDAAPVGLSFANSRFFSKKSGMIAIRLSKWIKPLCLVAGLIVASGKTSMLHAADAGSPLKLQVQLIWGTNGAKPTGQDLKDVEQDISKRLRSVFKWRNYFEVARKQVSVNAEKPESVKLSEKCVAEIENLGDSSIKVRIIGEGQLFGTHKGSISPGELISIASEDINDTAWFVVLRLQ